jgi:hypothetical protein
MRPLPFAFPALALLAAGCTDPAPPAAEKPTAVAEASAGGTATAKATADGATANGATADGAFSTSWSAADLPAFAPLYPGAKVTTQVAKAAGDGTRGGMVVLRTDDPVAKVIAFYDAKAKEAGLKASMMVNDEEGAVRIFGDNDGTSGRGALIAIGKSDEGKGTEIVITAGDSKIRHEMEKKMPRPVMRLQ